MSDTAWKMGNTTADVLKDHEPTPAIPPTKRIVVSVADTPHYRRGQERLRAALNEMGETSLCFSYVPAGWPQHSEIPYGFKACALQFAADRGHRTLIWADAAIYPLRSLEPLWERIERDGYWFSANGYSNYEWTADGAYPDLFEKELTIGGQGYDRAWTIEEAKRANKLSIPHVVATAFGISLDHEIGRQFLAEYYRLATTTKAFCGPWINSNHADNTQKVDGVRCAPCGGPDVRGHRHDQVAASVLAWRLGMKLTESPNVFAYGKVGDETDERTILLADGGYL